MAIHLFQFGAVCLDVFLPGLMPCEVMIYVLVCLHPVLTFCGTNVLLCLRQHFVMTTLRETPLQPYISRHAGTVSAIMVAILVFTAVFIFSYIFWIDRLKPDLAVRWIQISQTDRCLADSNVTLPFTALTLYGNLAFLVAICVMDVVPIVQYVACKLKFGSVIVHMTKYIEIIACKAFVLENSHNLWTGDSGYVPRTFSGAFAYFHRTGMSGHSSVDDDIWQPFGDCLPWLDFVPRAAQCVRDFRILSYPRKTEV